MVATVIAVPVVVVIAHCRSRCDQCQGCDCRRGLLTLVIGMVMGVMPAFHDKFGRAPIIYPNSSAVVVPGTALPAVRIRRLAAFLPEAVTFGQDR